MNQKHKTKSDECREMLRASITKLLMRIDKPDTDLMTAIKQTIGECELAKAELIASQSHPSIAAEPKPQLASNVKPLEA
jgi:hypothetical protein